MPKPPSYEQSLQHVLEGKKQIYVDPQYIPPHDYEELPPGYDEDKDIDYFLNKEDEINVILEII